jgi:tRNA-uridine aminocarboxypropyltransferase
VLVIQQARERKSQSNTGALLAKVLANSKLVLHGLRGALADLSDLEDPRSDAVVLFPVHDVPVVSNESVPEVPGRRRILVVLDATWPQARRMSQRIRQVRRLPFVRLPDGAAPRFILRKPRRPGFLATAEAVALALHLLGEATAAAAVRDGLSTVVRTVLEERGRPVPAGD